MAKTDPLDPNVPASTESPRMGDERIRALARAVAELLNVDHYMGTEGGAGTGYNEDAAGEHKKVKFNAPISTPTNETDKMFIYGKDVGSKIELHCLDEDGNEIQLTSAGNLYSPLSKMETIQAIDATGILIKNDGGNTVVTVGDDGTTTLADGSQLASATAPTTDADIVNKKYVDDRRAYIKLIDSRSSGTNGGSFISGSWYKRTVTEEIDTGNHCSVTSSVITLDAGTYECFIMCPAYMVNSHKARLRNTTADSTVLVGTTEYNSASLNITSHSIIRGRFTIAASQNLEIQHRCTTTKTTTGFGAAVSYGENEIYTVAEFWKI